MIKQALKSDWLEYLLYAAILYIVFSFRPPCHNQSEKSNGKSSTTVQGTISNPVLPYVVLERVEQPVSKKDTFQLDEKGSFRFAVNGLEEVKHYRLHFAKSGDGAAPGLQRFNWVDIPLCSGLSLQVNLDAKNMPASLTIDGKGKELPAYYADKVNTNRDFNKVYTKMVDQPKAAFLSYIEKYNAQSMNNIGKHLGNAGYLPAFYAPNEQKIVTYNVARMKCFYASRQINKAKNDSILAEFDDNYFDFIKLIPFNSQEELKNGTYASFIGAYVDYQVAAANKGAALPASDLMTQKYKTYQKLFTQQQMQDALLYDFLNKNNNDASEPWFVQCLNQYNLSAKNDSLKAELNNIVAIRKKLGKGQQAIDFNLPDVTGKLVSLAAFKGKYVYIDTWATWCGPCLAEIPYLKNLQQEYANRNIVFVSISIDADSAKWRKFTVAKGLEGTHLWAGSKTDKGYSKDYMIQGIPRFILIDPDGKFVDANAPRPSWPELGLVLRSQKELGARMQVPGGHNN